MNDYKIAFRAACADLGAVSALLGYESYPGIDQLLGTIADLIAERRPADLAEDQVIWEIRFSAECAWTETTKEDALKRKKQGYAVRMLLLLTPREARGTGPIKTDDPC